MPNAKSLYGPYAFDCPIYKKWRKQLELEKRVMESIPKKFWDRTFQNFEAVSEDLALALNITKKYVAKRAWEKGANIVISGKYGVGKTHLIALGWKNEKRKNGGKSEWMERDKALTPLRRVITPKKSTYLKRSKSLKTYHHKA